jgi:hypothetical protein
VKHSQIVANSDSVASTPFLIASPATGGPLDRGNTRPDGTPHVTLTWAGFDGDEIVTATFFYFCQRRPNRVHRVPAES